MLSGWAYFIDGSTKNMAKEVGFEVGVFSRDYSIAACRYTLYAWLIQCRALALSASYFFCALAISKSVIVSRLSSDYWLLFDRSVHS